MYWSLITFRLKQFWLVHPLNSTYSLNTSIALIYTLHIKRPEDKIYWLNISIVSVTNLVATYL
jgi:hypothetical protein